MGPVGIIGGTGVGQLLDNTREVKMSTPYGATSDQIVLGTLEGREVALLHRHGRNHTIPPHMINFRANIWALKELGCERILATAAVGSLKEELKAGDIVVPDQFIDWGKQVHTFYDSGKFYHVSMADPFCRQLRDLLISKAKGLPMHEKGTYLKIDGPQFSTRAASRMYRQFADIIGMTCVPEAILAREQGMCLACLATVTDYDVWADQPANFSEIKTVMEKNLENTKRILSDAVPGIPEERACPCGSALDNAGA